jgi:hypothetical protein
MPIDSFMLDRQKSLDLPWILLTAGIGLLAAILYRNLLHAQYVMDEFQQASMAASIHWGLWPYRDYPADKTVLGTFFYVLPHLISNETAVIVLLSRHMALLYALATVAVLYFLYRRVFDGRYGPLPAVFWALACSNFLEHGFCIRVDMLMTMFAILGVFLYLKLGSWRGALAAGAMLGLAFCSTQKAAYFIVAFTAAYAVTARKASARPIRDFALYAGAGLAVFLLYALAFGQGVYFLNVLRNTFFSPAAVGVALGSEYGSMFLFYRETFLRNILFYCLALAGLVYSAWRWRSNTWQQNFLACFTFIIAFFMAIHRSPWPYVFVMIIPFFGAYAALISERLLDRVRDTRLKWALASAALAIVLAGSLVRHQKHLRVTNALQYHTVQAAEAILNRGDTYYDAIAMLSTRRHADDDMILVRVILLDVLRNWETKGPALLDRLRAEQCKLIIFNYRIAALPKDFTRSWLPEHYVLFDTNLWVSGARITQSPRTVDLIWGGNYVAVAASQLADLRIDGRPIKPLTETSLAPGSHEVRFTGSGIVVLIPAEAYQWLRRYKVDPRLDIPLYFDVYSI